jgi:putative FmdB family regulatory protein
MPTYEYACKSCGEHVEVVQSFKDDPLTECPACGGPLRKVFGNIGIAFKGSGFYKTDSRRTGGSNGSGGSGKETKEKESTTSSSSEASSKTESPSKDASSAASSSSSSSGGSDKAAAAKS